MPKFMWRQGTYLRDIPHTFCCASDPLHIHEYDYSKTCVCHTVRYNTFYVVLIYYIMILDCAGRFGWNLHGKTARSALYLTVKVAGGGTSVCACSVFLR